MENEGFAVSQKIFCWVVICQNVFSPKAAGWTQRLAFENYENVENHELPRFNNFVRPNGTDMGSTKLGNVFPVISVQSILSQLPSGAFCVFGWDRVFKDSFNNSRKLL